MGKGARGKGEKGRRGKGVKGNRKERETWKRGNGGIGKGRK